jgi:2-polyprenyl-3-methyl-5-hydroxy-6-metoxy-1,4-benzoquinol methylase
MYRIVLAVFLAVPILAHAQAGKGKSAEQVWNELYAKREGVEHQFNKFLAESVRGRKPGRALDIGMGQGRNSLFLAALGWDVTGFDIAEVGVRQAQAEAKKRGLKLNARVGDVDKFDYGKARWDLVVGRYMHDFITRNADRIVASLKPGGMLVVEGIHRDVAKANLQGKAYGHRSNDLLKHFAKLRVKHYEDTMSKADWERSGGKPVPVVRMLAVNQP